MNEQQVAEAKRIAIEIMGWQWEQYASTGYTENLTCRFNAGGHQVHEDGTLDANAYVGRIRPSEGRHVIRWYRWDPFDTDWHEVFVRLTDLGREVTLVGAKGFFSCSISGWYALENGSNLYTERGTSKLPGHAICEACIKFLDKSKNHEPATI